MHPSRLPFLLIVLGVTFLLVGAMNLVLAMVLLTRINRLETTTFNMQYAPDRGNYARLYEDARQLQARLSDERRSIYWIAGGIMAFGVMFILWGLDRRRLTQPLTERRRTEGDPQG